MIIGLKSGKIIEVDDTSYDMEEYVICPATEAGRIYTIPIENVEYYNEELSAEALENLDSLAGRETEDTKDEIKSRYSSLYG